MKILIFAQFGPNLSLTCRKFCEDSKNNHLSTLRSLLFELWPKNIQVPPLTLFTKTPLEGFKILGFEFCRLGMLDLVLFNMSANFQVPELSSMEDRGGAI